MVRALFMILDSMTKTSCYSGGWAMAAMLILNYQYTVENPVFQENIRDPIMHGCTAVRVPSQNQEHSIGIETVLNKYKRNA